jgi:hypothetical protein
MNKKQIEKRIKYLNMELAHAHYHDGWVLTGMKEELSKLNKDLDLYGEK